MFGCNCIIFDESSTALQGKAPFVLLVETFNKYYRILS